jgi:hypothetical protein
VRRVGGLFPGTLGEERERLIIISGWTALVMGWLLFVP